MEMGMTLARHPLTSEESAMPPPDLIGLAFRLG
jgi:hypothetical protein